MTPAEHIAQERWEIDCDDTCVVVVQGTTTAVAVMGDPQDEANAEDWRRITLVAAAPDLLDMVRTCRAQFAFYAERHRAKRTPEGADKARTNDAMVAKCDAIIAKAWPTVAPLPNGGGQ